MMTGWVQECGCRKQNGYMIHSSIYFKDNKGPKKKI